MRLRTAALTVAAAACAAALAASPQASAQDDLLPEAPGKARVVTACTGCHQAAIVVAQRRTPDGWDEVIGKMVDRGAVLTEAEQDEVYAYLVKAFGTDAAPRP